MLDCQVRAVKVVCGLAALAVLAGACGSRRSDEEIAAAAGGRVVETRGAAEEQLLDDGAVAGDGAVGVGPDGTSDPGDASTADADGSPAQAAAQGQPAARTKTAAAGAARGTAADKPPLRIGVVGTMSGVGGTQLGSTRAVQAWAQAQNAKGGVNGQPIEVLVVDDAGDPARFRSALQEMVEQRGVVAFVGALSGFSITEGAIKYLEQKRVPIVGGDRLSALWNSSPMMFPQASAGDAVIWNHAVNTLRIVGKGTPVGWITCQEAQICKDADRLWQVYMPQLGLDVRYRAQVSVAQPNFTAECTRAMQAGVKVFLLGTDANSTRRVATSCERQGYKPMYAVLQTSDEMAQEAALEGGFFGSATFPWVLKDTPATREFQDVMSKYAPGVGLSAHSSSGWTAAKLFERVASGGTGLVTTEQVLENLWALRDDTLGGLTSPLSYVRDKGAPPSYCFFPMEIRKGAWSATPRDLVCREP